MAFKWQCYACAPNSGYRFSRIAGTIFENTNKPLRDWFRVIHMMLTSKKGISALQIHARHGLRLATGPLGTCATASAPGWLTKNSASSWALSKSMKPTSAARTRTSHWTSAVGTGAAAAGKIAVIGAVERKGNVVARVIDRVEPETLCTLSSARSFRQTFRLLATDEHRGYRGIVGSSSRTVPSITRRASTSSARSTRIRSKASGRLLSAASSAPITRSARNISRSMSPS